MRKELLLVSGLLIGSMAFAIDPAEIDSLINLKGVVVSANKIHVNRNSVPLSISVIEREEIEASSESALLPVLSERVPGLFVTEKGITGFGVSEGAAGTVNIRAPPYSSAKDPANMAGFMIEDLESGKVRQFHWDEVDGLPRDGSAALLDVRTEWEYQRGHLDGFQNVPLDDLREHLDELDRSKPVYVNCQTGLRSYLACRLL